MKQKNSYLYYMIPVLGILFCLWYVKIATYDIVYTDYIRLVNSYLPDVWNPSKFFTADILTRIPVNYLARIVNILFFHYSTTFDMVLGVLGLGLGGFMLAVYSSKRNLGYGWFLLTMAVYFSLNKWEMLTNGSGWTHFMAFGCFYYHYLVLDRMIREGEEKDYRKLLVLPWLVTLMVAGPYCAIYSVTLILFYGGYLVYGRLAEGHWDKRYVNCLFCTLIPLLLYIWSNAYAVEDHAGAVDISVWTVIQTQPVFFIRFLLKSFASSVMGIETYDGLVASTWGVAHPLMLNRLVYLLGAVVAALYLMSLWANLRYRIYEETMFPILLLVAGGLNHLLILTSRWIFLKENYGMSSRYALQYQIGIMGILLTAALVWNRLGHTAREMRTEYVRCRYPGFIRLITLFCCGMILTLNVVTTKQELAKAPYREEYAVHIAEVALNFENETDDVLRKTFDYRKSKEDSGAKVREALTILKENQWNIYYYYSEGGKRD